ncbi:macrolide ABC transporter ATP-binding protein [Candidatus Jorgensenbacteria bacterium RIFCSPLOWO2_02_FULL_45_12]|uniref:Macrolide ABC transporter ATP-binding protein n=1 Tax=Candidatus Jorgensenbacteria bacterium RIFCSPHIGHO2_02_FULL_45_20 TaxID=1798470 RepID=A0A1F6BQ29_9BACT|nr:MAG: macrolide ABC transporter ATP-binding protein [Candidatus Jorgensenbacteria bacterium RIFCSPHIGHO2_02_FULL_45_20]OGG42271.1 MAG: macrolide ABC transporter ATP-binding protein [Candidatus Jorgensenbacteria bacterium RIFCSPLOWO2_02_FULL_45_12]
MEPLIRTEKLEKVYKNDGVETTALHGVTFGIRRGEFVAIMGPSGSGKSTLMQILGCLDRPTSGEYFFEDKELHTYTDDELARIRNEKIGFVFQAFNLLPRISVIENVELPLVYRGVPPKERRERARRMIYLVGLGDREDYRASRLSGGQKQRAAIARALITTPEIIFADEPTGNLDSMSGGMVLELFQNLNEKGNTIVIVTHESYVAKAGKRVLHIVDGEIDKDEEVEERRVISREGFSK